MAYLFCLCLCCLCIAEKDRVAEMTCMPIVDPVVKAGKVQSLVFLSFLALLATYTSPKKPLGPWPIQSSTSPRCAPSLVVCPFFRFSFQPRYRHTSLHSTLLHWMHWMYLSIRVDRGSPKNMKRKENTTSKPSVRPWVDDKQRCTCRGTYAEKRESQHVSLLLYSLSLFLCSLALCLSAFVVFRVHRSCSLPKADMFVQHYDRKTRRDKSLETNVSYTERLSQRHSPWFIFCLFNVLDTLRFRTTTYLSKTMVAIIMESVMICDVVSETPFFRHHALRGCVHLSINDRPGEMRYWTRPKRLIVVFGVKKIRMWGEHSMVSSWPSIFMCRSEAKWLVRWMAPTVISYAYIERSRIIAIKKWMIRYIYWT